jgi:YgiT-type zinc finger domain-containing protein
MKTCYSCKGNVVRKRINVEINGVVVQDVEAEVCERCGEEYFNTRTATFIQNVARFVEKEKAQVMATPASA